ncbi:MAG: DUF4340 domain-containing protein [Alphaproteobacteria bacterium]|nr:DUF4340 domain-containing protein [Alphaproteobacteria bacterium]
MQKRGFVLVLCATVILVAAAIGVLASGDRGVSPAPVGERALPDLAGNLNELAWITLSRGKTKIDFAQIAGRWAIAEKGNYPAAQGRMRQLLLGLADLTLVEAKTERPELFARLDLDDPANGKATEVKLNDLAGKTVAALIVGKHRADRFGGGNDAVYVRKPGIDRAWLARGALDVSDDVVQWLDRRILDIPAARIASVKLTAEDGNTLVLSRSEPGGRFAVGDAPADAKLKEPAALAEPAAALAALDLADVKPASDQPLPDSGVGTASFATFDELTIDLRVFTRDSVDWVAITASGKEATEAEAKAINTKVAGWSYAVAPDRAKLLRTRLADLVEPAKGS